MYLLNLIYFLIFAGIINVRAKSIERQTYRILPRQQPTNLANLYKVLV